MLSDPLEWREVCKARGCERRGNGLSQEMARCLQGSKTSHDGDDDHHKDDDGDDDDNGEDDKMAKMTMVMIILATDFLRRWCSMSPRLEAIASATLLCPVKAPV